MQQCLYYQKWQCFVSSVKFWKTKLHKNVCFKAKNVCLKAKNVLQMFLLSFSKNLRLWNFRLVLILLITSKLAMFSILRNTKLQNCLPFAGPYNMVLEDIWVWDPCFRSYFTSEVCHILSAVPSSSSTSSTRVARFKKIKRPHWTTLGHIGPHWATLGQMKADFFNFFKITKFIVRIS